MTLDQCIGTALLNNRDLKNAAYELKKSQLDFMKSIVSWCPSFKVDVSYLRLKEEIEGFDLSAFPVGYILTNGVIVSDGPAWPASSAGGTVVSAGPLTPITISNTNPAVILITSPF